MKEIIPDIKQWQTQHKPIAVATVIQTWGSAPRKAGAKMALTADNEMSGSVSGGCVEGAVVQEALDILISQTPKLVAFGISNESAWEVGLACGGNIEVYIEPIC